MYKYIFYIQTVSNLMILSGLSVVKSKSLKAAGFADITKLGFINEKWVEKRTLAAWLLFQRRFFFSHTSSAIHSEDSITRQVMETSHHWPWSFDTSMMSHE